MAHSELHEHRSDGYGVMDFCFGSPAMTNLANAMTTEIIKSSVRGNLVGILGKDYKGLATFSALCVYYLGDEIMEESY